MQTHAAVGHARTAYNFKFMSIAACNSYSNFNYIDDSLCFFFWWARARTGSDARPRFDAHGFTVNLMHHTPCAFPTGLRVCV